MPRRNKTASAAAATVQSPADSTAESAAGALALPSELTIYTVGELHPQWLTWLAGADDAAAPMRAVHGDAVAEADAAGVQLLLSLHRALAQRGSRLHLRSPSAALMAACEGLGLSDWMQGLKAAQPAAAAA